MSDSSPMDDTPKRGDWLAEQFEMHREHLRSVAFRMLGSLADADDAVQEAWLKVIRADTSDVENLGGWLTTVVARVSLDVLRSRESRREDSIEDVTDVTDVSEVAAFTPSHEASPNPEQEAVLADSVGLALLVVLDRLNPAERLAFVLHDMFALPFEEIGQIIGRNAAAARQLASRARRRVQGGNAIRDETVAEQARVVDAFLTALRVGDFEGLLAVLDPDVVVRADAAVGATGVATEVRGAATWAKGAVMFGRMASLVQPALINGSAGLVWAPRGRLKRVMRMTITDGRITEVDIVADAERLAGLELSVL